MLGRRVVPGALSRKVGQKLGGVDLAHPVVGVGPVDAVLGVGERSRRSDGRLLHGRHRSLQGLAAAAVALLVAAVASLGLAAPAAAADTDKTTFTVALLN